MTIRCLVAVLVFCAVGCESIIGPDPVNTPGNNFGIFWSDFDRYYAQFGIRGIDWDSVRAVAMPRLNSGTTDQELFSVLSSIVLALDDMHVTLYTPLGEVYSRNVARGTYPSGKLINASKYIILGSPQRSVMEYRRCRGENIGYVIIPTFEGSGGNSLSDGRYLVIDEVLRQLGDTKGIILDLRWNSGGNIFNAETVAARFADRKRPFMRYCVKNGPGKNDFSGWIVRTVEPKGPSQYTKPVVVLTSRATSSAAECFVLAMKEFPHVVIVGDTTGGGVGNPIFRELPNGWVYRLSTEIGASADGAIIEGRGIPPDIHALTTAADSLNGIDRILEEGIEVIRNGGAF